LRVWLAEHLADELGAASVAGAPLVKLYARALGAHVDRHVDLHSLPPVTGMLRLGKGCSGEPEVDLSGYWIDGDVFNLGRVEGGKRAPGGARRMPPGGTRVRDDAGGAPGSAVFGQVPEGQYWWGAPAARTSKHSRGYWSDEVPRNRKGWVAAYTMSGLVIALLPLLAVAA